MASIFDALNLYVQEVNKTPASKIAHMEENINESRMFMEMYEEGIQNTQDPTQIIELRNGVEDCRLEIVR